MLLGRLDGRLLGNTLSWLTREGVIRAGQGTLRAGELLMSSHPLTNFEIQKCQHFPRFNAAYSKDSILKVKDGACETNLDEYGDTGTHWFAIYVKINVNRTVPVKVT